MFHYLVDSASNVVVSFSFSRNVVISSFKLLLISGSEEIDDSLRRSISANNSTRKTLQMSSNHIIHFTFTYMIELKFITKSSQVCNLTY